MTFKGDYISFNITWELTAALFAAEKIWNTITTKEMMVTSLNDSKHRVGSKHYEGNAADIRSHEIPNALCAVFIDEINKTITGFRAWMEFKDEPNEHIHIEKK